MPSSNFFILSRSFFHLNFKLTDTKLIIFCLNLLYSSLNIFFLILTVFVSTPVLSRSGMSGLQDFLQHFQRTVLQFGEPLHCTSGCLFINFCSQCVFSVCLTSQFLPAFSCFLFNQSSYIQYIQIHPFIFFFYKLGSFMLFLFFSGQTDTARIKKLRNKVDTLPFTSECLVWFSFHPHYLPRFLPPLPWTNVLDASKVACHFCSPYSTPHMVSSYLSNSTGIIELPPCPLTFVGSAASAR